MKCSETALSKLAAARSVCALTGSGISAESGVPTFRGSEGLWSKFRPEELASAEAFLRNPQLVWEWYAYRRKIIRDVKPNDAHRALVEFETLVPVFTLVTQNVDGLHQRAGSRGVIELHGNIERSYCIECHAAAAPDDPAFAQEIPRCCRCGGLLRPDVVWFGEVLPQEAFRRAELAARESDVCLIIGTSGLVYPAASIPLSAKEYGSYVIEVNIEPTELTSMVSETLLGKAGETLPELVHALRSRKGKTL